jgi:hypothetical protein
MKKLVGLGCSWAQGEGGYPEHIWKEYNGRVNLRGVPDEHLRPYEYENSWVNVLCRDYLQEYTPINLGIRGIGIRAAVKQLYLTDQVDWEKDEGLIILFLPGLERLGVFNNQPHAHYRYNHAWPHDHNPPRLFWQAYKEELYGFPMICMEAMTAIIEAQVFAERYNFQFAFANAYYLEHLPEFFKQHIGDRFTSLVHWDKYMNNDKNFFNFVEELVKMDNILPFEYRPTSYFQHYLDLPWPPKYLTNCIHPTIEGYKVIASLMYDFLKKNNYDI